MTYVIHYNEHLGDITDLDYYCSHGCMFYALLAMGVKDVKPHVAGEYKHKTEGWSVTYGSWPGGVETDYPVYCADCHELMWEGLYPVDDLYGDEELYYD